MVKKKEIKNISIGAGAIFLFLSIMSFVLSESNIMAYIFLIFSVIVGVIPYSIYVYMENTKFSKMEEHFPAFLRAFAEAKKSGMTFPQALISISKNDYGNLSPEIKRSANQLSWDIPFQKVLKNLAKRIKGSKIIKQSFVIINESYKSGGNVAETMDSLAMDIGIIKSMRDEKKSVTSQQIVIMYFIFFLFLGIIIALYNLLIPMLQFQLGPDVFGLGLTTAQTDVCNMAPFLCGFCPALGIESTGYSCYFKMLFLFMTIIQGAACGIIAGEISTGTVVGGIKHSLIMITSAVVVFLVFLG